MATDVRSTTSPYADRSSDQSELVDSRLAAARRQLRLVDLASGVALLAISLLVYFLLLAIVEHWLAPLGSVARFAAWAAMIVGGGYFLVVRLLPTILKPINPVFAAKTIEDGDPTLNNSLINFLLFRHRREEVRPVVYQALEHQASSAAARVSPEAVIDRSGLIKLGYVLAGILALFAAYEIATPKAALQTVQRILMPWAAIDAPTRVTISEVTPGNADAYRGQSVEIGADVRGLHDEEPVTLMHSTADGQIVDQPIVMQRVGETGHRFHALLPEAGGLAQDTTYRIVAGDGLSPEFRVTTLDEPTITVTRVDYQPPKYTGREPRTVEGSGDVNALEQTLVTIHAEANYPIESGLIEFDPELSDKPIRQKLEVDGHSATASFRLALATDRVSPKFGSYQLTIKTVDGVSNLSPILHMIEVVPDLDPEVQILTPEARRIELPQDGEQLIEARAIDPDFGLAGVTLRATVDGKALLSESLLSGDKQPRQSRGEYKFRPMDLKLTVGTEVVYWIEANDNRLQEPTQSHEPNRAKTELYRIRITPPLRPMRNEQSDDPNQDQPGSAPQSDPSRQDPNNATEPNPNEPADDPNDNGATAEGDENSEGDPNDSGSDSGTDQAEGAGGESQQEGELGEGDGDDRAGQGSNPNGPEGADQTGSGGSQALGAGGNKPGDQTGGAEGDSGGTDPAAGNEPGGDPSNAGKQGDSAGGGGEGSERQPLSADGAEDAEAIERIKKYFDEQAKRNGEPTQGTEAGEQPEAGSEANPNTDAEGAAGEQQSANNGTGGENDRDPNGGGETKPGEDRNAASSDPGGMPQGADDRRPEDAAGADPAEQDPNANGGQGTTGDSGAGKPKQNDTPGAPEAQGENRDKPKDKPDSGTGDKPNDEAQSPSISNEQSDSEGETGNRSGGGGEGGGQAAKQPGNDSPGSTTAADEGAGAADEPGPGETGEGPGGEETADGPTGQSGEQPGDGTRNQPGAGEAPPGEGSTNNDFDGQASENPADPNNTGGQRQGPAGTSAARQGGGEPGSAPNGSEIDLPGEAPEAQEVNLDYARKATNLVLEKIAEQEQTSQELLDDLGWTEEEMKQFVDRWKSLVNKADQQGTEGDEAREELDEALESLGLVPESGRKVESNADDIGNTRDAGFRSQPPEKFRRLYDAFRRGG